MCIVISSPQRGAFWISGIVTIISVCVSGCAGLMDRHFKDTVDAPQGVVVLKGLAAPVTIRRDAYGIPLIEAGNRGDLAMAAAGGADRNRCVEAVIRYAIGPSRLNDR